MLLKIELGGEFIISYIFKTRKLKEKQKRNTVKSFFKKKGREGIPEEKCWNRSDGNLKVLTEQRAFRKPLTQQPHWCRAFH